MFFHKVVIDTVAHYGRDVLIPFADAEQVDEACRAAVDSVQGLDVPHPSDHAGNEWGLVEKTMRTRVVQAARTVVDAHVVGVSLTAWACRDERVEADDRTTASARAVDTGNPPTWPAAEDGWTLAYVEALTACDPEPEIEPEPEVMDEASPDADDEGMTVAHLP